MIRARSARLTTPLTFSFLLHAAAVGALFYSHTAKFGVESQPMRVRLVAAPKGPAPEIGTVVKDPAKAEPKAAKERTAPVVTRRPDALKVPTPSKVKAPAPPKQTETNEGKKALKSNSLEPDNKSTKAPTADAVAASKNGGAGNSVADVVFQGMEFSDQRYLDNIVNRIAKEFHPAKSYTVVAEFTFDIKRNGCIDNLRVVKSSPIADFNLEAKTSILMAGANCAFGVLPDSWHNDILNVKFRFDPRIIR